VTAEGKKCKVETVFIQSAIGNKQSGVVKVGKYVYGYNEDRNWACQDFATGQIAWPKKRAFQKLKAGGMVAADGRLYLLDDTGTVAMLEASPKAYKVVSQFTLPADAKKMRKSSGGLWTHPSLSDGKLYLRDQNLVFCYQVK
jgi:outer membrane protein assembly factor BamB